MDLSSAHHAVKLAIEMFQDHRYKSVQETHFASQDKTQKNSGAI